MVSGSSYPRQFLSKPRGGAGTIGYDLNEEWWESDVDGTLFDFIHDSSFGVFYGSTQKIRAKYQLPVVLNYEAVQSRIWTKDGYIAMNRSASPNLFVAWHVAVSARRFKQMTQILSQIPTMYHLVCLCWVFNGRRTLGREQILNYARH